MEPSQQACAIFVEDAALEPARIPVTFVVGEKKAEEICKAMKATEYGGFDFTFRPWTAANRVEGAAWAAMAQNARAGVYGEDVAGVHVLIERIVAIIGGRATKEKPPAGPMGKDQAEGKTACAPTDMPAADVHGSGADGEGGAYVAAVELWQSQFPNYQKAKRFLKKHPEIRTRKPAVNKLEIHAADWTKFFAAQDRASFDNLADDGNRESIADDPEATDEFLAGAAERLAAFRANKKAGHGPRHGPRQ